MQQTLLEQTWIFLWSFVIGAVLAAGYTVLSLIRILLPPSRRILFVSDFLFVTAAALLNFLFALSQTFGRIRGYVVAAESASFFLLYLTVGRLLCKSAFRLRSFVLKLRLRLRRPLRRLWRSVREKMAKKCRKMPPFSKKT